MQSKKSAPGKMPAAACEPGQKLAVAVDPELKGAAVRRLRRIAGQVRGLESMVEQERYCADILTQIAAVRSALDAVGTQVLTEHITGCLLKQGEEHPEAHVKTPAELEEEVKTLLARLMA